jgi:hypothetical protein
VIALPAVLVAAITDRLDNRHHTADLVTSLLAPPSDKTAIVVRVILLVASATVAGLGLVRPLIDTHRDPEAAHSPVATRLPDTPTQTISTVSASSASAEAGEARSPGTPQASLDAVVPTGVRPVAWVAAVAVAAACIAAVEIGQSGRPVATAQLVLALAVPLLITARRQVWPAGLAGVMLAALASVEFSAGRAGLPLVLDAGYVVAATVLLGTLVFAVALLGGHARSRVALPARTRLGQLAVTAGAVVAVTGIAQLLLTGPNTFFDLYHTGYGVAAVVQAALPVLVTATWLFAIGPMGRPRAAELARLAAGGLALALVAAALVATFPRPLAAPEPGQPLLRPVNLGLRHLAVLVVPMRPGPNLVHVGDAGGAQMILEHHHGQAPAPAVSGPITVSTGSGTGSVPIGDRGGAPGGWAVLDIPAGTDRLHITGDGTTATVPVNVGTTTTADPALRQALAGPDGPECASAALGGLLAGTNPAASLTEAAPLACPSQSLTEADASSLRDTVAFLASRRIRALDLVSDDSPRSHAAADLVRTEATRRHLPISASPGAGDTLLVVSGWSQGKDALGKATTAADRVPDGGIVLAPWLLTGGVLGSASSEVLALRFNPQNVDPRQYASTVSTVFPGETPSAAGYLAWAAQHRLSLDTRATFYGAAPVNVPMGMGDDMNMGGQPSDWYPGGTVVPINPPLPPNT